MRESKKIMGNRGKKKVRMMVRKKERNIESK